jgi:PhnB protein
MNDTIPANDDSEMRLIPFIYFYGRCEEALTCYADALGGSYSINMRNASEDPRLSPGFGGKVSQAEFRAPGITVMASDGPGPRTIDPSEGNISLAVTIPDMVKAERAFTLLAAGGAVKAPLQTAPWGGTFGILHDRFGTEWIMNIP